MPDTTHRNPLAGLMSAQFFGAFNDNAWKYVVLTLSLRPAMATMDIQSDAYERTAQLQTTTAMLAFVIPMMMLSIPAGILSDRFSKRSVIVGAKALESLLMAGAAMSLLLAPTQLVIPMVLLALMGVQSALFGPAKYGILPELVPHEKLSHANGLIEMWTMIAIIAGTAIGPVLLAMDNEGTCPEATWYAAGILAVLAVTGLASAFFVPRVKPAQSSTDEVKGPLAAWDAVRTDRGLSLAVLGSVVYWTMLSLLGQNVYIYARQITAAMSNQELYSGLPAATFGIGIGAGAMLAARMSGEKVEVGLIPLGTILFALFASLLAAVQPFLVGTIILMGLLGIGAGMIIVPLHAVIQWRSPNEVRGSIIAMSNVLTLAGVALGTLAATALAMMGFSTVAILLVSAGVLILTAIWAMWMLPQAFVRLALVLLGHILYRLKVIDTKHVPQEGGALLVPNHLSYIDALFILASVDRPVRFIMNDTFYNKPYVYPIAKTLRSIPINSTGGPRMILNALRTAGEALDKGELVCIFAEGQISRTGALLSFRRGMQRIVKGRNVPIIPVHLDRVWGSIFSYERGRFFTKRPKQLPYPVTVSYGEPLPTTTPFWQVRQAVMELGTAAWQHRLDERKPVSRTLIKSLRRKGRGLCMMDDNKPHVSGIDALAGSIALARKLKSKWNGQTRIGIMLPASVGGAMANFAATLSGRSTVNLNFTTGQSALESAISQSELKTVITTRPLLEKLPVKLPDSVEVIYLEDISPTITKKEKLFAWALARLAPARMIERSCGKKKRGSLQDEITVIFSSGSTGDPKGVVLTHQNIDANVEATAQLFQPRPSDRMLGILPLFHSFGYMTLWFAVNNDVAVSFHPNPLDAGAIGKKVEEQALTVIIATPTFLQLYIRRCDAGQFGSLRMVLTGAEKLPARVSDAFEQAFGIRPIEGYGMTECAPVVTASSPDVRYRGIYQAGSRKGSVGLPMPGVSVRVVDPDTFEPLAPGESGMLLVAGPNVMQGYLNRADLTRKAFHDGWYITGDIAFFDEDGFIHITDRLSRFSKISGEMVPHGKVEEALHEAADVTLPTFAVTALPDEKKGERLIVLHTYNENQIGDVIGKLAGMGLPNLFVPREDQFIKVDELPMLGTGKLDLKALKQIAQERMGSAET